MCSKKLFVPVFASTMEHIYVELNIFFEMSTTFLVHNVV